MGTRLAAFVIAAALLIPGAAYAQCSVGTQVLNTCAGYTFQGCCTLDNHVRWCENGVTCDIDCNPGAPLGCGWMAAQQFYDCGQTPGADPTCANPYSCIKGGCLPSAQKGCCNCPCQACVCAKSPTCCSVQWTAQCVNLCKVDCGGCGSTNGCTTSTTPGCAGCSCELCVCNQDAFCCQVAWDATCANTCKNKCGGQCGCVPSCAGKQCGSDGCGGSCGTCPAGYQCDAIGHCACVPSCAGKQCGDDGCGGSCGTCPPKYTCAGNVCKCIPDCVAKQCGDDGCGGSCGTCPQNMKCDSFNCVPGQCTPKCDGKQCGDDTCGGTCGSCPDGFTCSDGGLCEPVGCTPQCEGKQCGDDQCGGSCGTCAEGDECNDGLCAPVCVPDCNGKACGDDQCGGLCGTCAEGDECKDGQCVPVCKPFCLNKECGPNGCGSECGTCGPGFQCNEAGICIVDEDVKPMVDVVEDKDLPAVDDSGKPETIPQVDAGDSAAPPPDSQPTEHVPSADQAAGPDPSADLTGDSGAANPCPPGFALYYGQCAKVKEEEPPKDGKSSGCSMATELPGDAAPSLLLLAAVFFLFRAARLLRRGSV